MSTFTKSFKRNQYDLKHTAQRTEMIKSASKYEMATPRMYMDLSNHIKSPLRKVDSPDCAAALLLSVERFVGASKQQGRMESLRS
jgi:hypothetical protein